MAWIRRMIPSSTQLESPLQKWCLANAQFRYDYNRRNHTIHFHLTDRCVWLIVQSKANAITECVSVGSNYKFHGYRHIAMQCECVRFPSTIAIARSCWTTLMEFQHCIAFDGSARNIYRVQWATINSIPWWEWWASQINWKNIVILLKFRFRLFSLRLLTVFEQQRCVRRSTPSTKCFHFQNRKF